MDWRLIFKQSAVNGGEYGEKDSALSDNQDCVNTGAVNGGEYDEKDLVPRVFRPVTDSWFQKRLQYVRNELKKEMLLEPSRSSNDH
jgi:hypothetical protein